MRLQYSHVHAILSDVRVALLALVACSLFSQAALAAGPELLVAIQSDLPPYVMHDATQGIEVDIVHAVLPGYAVRFTQMSYDELETAVPHKKADLALNVQSMQEGVWYSRKYITFANYAISKKAAGLHIDSLADLKGHRVLTWQEAYLELGPEFERLFSPQSPYRKDYVEVADQRQQVRMFWQGTDDIIVIDRNVFSHFSRDMGHSMREVALHALFPATTSFKAAFQDAEVRDAFNRGLTTICQNGTYVQILERYQVELPRTVCD